ncbi:MAG: metallophosphoesterase family protein [Myxococcales bacterium]|nr:metallophosphoesterase family protein [Myxococcales bacterium]
MRKTWALGDIHANATALRAALAMLDESPADELVILGDLLTYGPDPAEVLDLVAERHARGAVLVLGNHDQLYQELLDGDTRYYDRLPAWIRASADFTLSRIDASVFSALRFVREHVVDGVLFAHANPWGDWRYLNTDSDHRDAARTMQQRWLKVGVFGHTHRARIVAMPSDERHDETVRWQSTGPRDVLLLNAGAVGQPRNRTATSTMLQLSADATTCHARLHTIHYDVSTHLQRLRELPLGADVIDRLGTFFEPRPAPARLDDRAGR